VLKKLTVAGIVATTASGVILFGTPAHAGIGTGGDGGIVAGNQFVVPVSIPVDVCGNAIALVGRAEAGCKGGATVGGARHHHGYHHPWDF
jgi:hypothetical protein